MSIDSIILRDIENLTSAGIESFELQYLLRSLHIMGPNKILYKNKLKKLYEIVHFTTHIRKCVEKISRKRRVLLLECGCGRSYLSFFANYVLRKVDRDTFFVGIDSELKLVEKCMRLQEEMHFDNMKFHAMKIDDYHEQRDVDITCALHACDTATDEAIAKGVELNSRYILVVPCCHRQVVQQLKSVLDLDYPLRNLLRTAVFRDRLGTVLTDALRMLALESMGYTVDVFEFVPSRITPKNIMLRAIRGKQDVSRSLEKYRALSRYLEVEPHIEKYLDLDVV